MKLIPLSRAKRCTTHKGKNLFAIVDDEDYDYLMQFKWTAQKKKNGSYYASRCLFKVGEKRKNIWMHREIMKTPDGMVTDHINHNGIDNRKINLRICTIKQNAMNHKKISGNFTSKYVGVCWKKGWWYSAIKHNKKQIHLGIFKDEKKAALAYNEKAKELFGEFANLNIIE